MSRLLSCLSHRPSLLVFCCVLLVFVFVFSGVLLLAPSSLWLVWQPRPDHPFSSLCYAGNADASSRPACVQNFRATRSAHPQGLVPVLVLVPIALAPSSPAISACGCGALTPGNNSWGIPPTRRIRALCPAHSRGAGAGVQDATLRYPRHRATSCCEWRARLPCPSRAFPATQCTGVMPPYGRRNAVCGRGGSMLLGTGRGGRRSILSRRSAREPCAHRGSVGAWPPARPATCLARLALGGPVPEGNLSSAMAGRRASPTLRLEASEFRPASRVLVLAL